MICSSIDVTNILGPAPLSSTIGDAPLEEFRFLASLETAYVDEPGPSLTYHLVSALSVRARNWPLDELSFKVAGGCWPA